MPTKSQQAPAQGGSDDDDDSWWGWLKSWIVPSGGIGGIFSMLFDVLFWGAIIGCVYYGLKTFEPQITDWLNEMTPEWKLGDTFKKGMDFIGAKVGGGLSKLFGNNDAVFGTKDAPKSEEAVQQIFASNGVEPALASAMAKYRTELRTALDSKSLNIVSAFDKDALPKTLPVLMQMSAAAKQAMIGAAMQAGSAQAGGNAQAGLSQRSKDMMMVLLTSKAEGMDEVRKQMPALLQPMIAQTSDAGTKAMLQFIANEKNLNAASQFVTAVGEDKLTTLMTAFATKDAQGNVVKDSPEMKAVQEAVKNDAVYKKALQDFAAGVDLNSIGDPQTKAVLALAQGNPSAAMDMVIKQLGAAEPAAGAAKSPPAESGKPPAVAKPTAPLKPGQKPSAAKPVAPKPAAAASNGSDNAFDPALVLGMDFSRMNSATINALGAGWAATARGTQNVAVNFIMMHNADKSNFPNLNAMGGFMKTVRANEKGNGAAHAVTDHVALALVGLLTGDTHAPAFKPEEVAQFFQTPAAPGQISNRDAFGKLLLGIDASALPKAQQDMLRVLRTNWDHHNGHGIHAILQDKASVAALMPGGDSRLANAVKTLFDNSPDMVIAHTPFVPTAIQNNVPDVRALEKVMEATKAQAR